MLKAIRFYVRWVDALNERVGRMVMYGIFMLMGVLLYSSLSKAYHLPALWTLETAQFIMVAYYMLGGGYSLLKGAHVRMDVVYGGLSPKRKAWIDSFSIVFLILYLVVLLQGGIDSTQYALEYKETSYSSWAPYMAPIKIIMCIGILLTLMQAIAEWFKDIAIIKGISL